jgi:ATP-dependent RNA helicase MSS116
VVLELHSRLSQPQRDRNAKAFREATGGVVMFASDVAARGLDFPGVTHVIQFGIASDAEQVVHRAGRTGRGGKRGEALTLLCDDESAVLPELAKLSIAVNTPPVVVSEVACMPAALLPAIKRISTPGDPLRAQACAALVAGLGFYKANLRRLKWNAQALVGNLVKRFEAIGLVGPPRCPVSPKLGLGIKEV